MERISLQGFSFGSLSNDVGDEFSSKVLLLVDHIIGGVCHPVHFKKSIRGDFSRNFLRWTSFFTFFTGILSKKKGSIIYGVDGCIYIHWHHFFVLNEKRSVNPYN